MRRACFLTLSSVGFIVQQYSWCNYILHMPPPHDTEPFCPVGLFAFPSVLLAVGLLIRGSELQWPKSSSSPTTPVCRAATLRGNFEVRLEALWHPVGSFVLPLVKHCYDVTPRYNPWMDHKMKWEMLELLERFGTSNTSLELGFCNG